MNDTKNDAAYATYYTSVQGDRYVAITSHGFADLIDRVNKLTKPPTTFALITVLPMGIGFAAVLERTVDREIKT